MGLIINVIAALILFAIPTYKYIRGGDIIVSNPLEKGSKMCISFELFFLVYSVVTAMFFLGPLSLVKYAFWIIFLIILSFKRLQLKTGPIITAYLIFLGWMVVSYVFFATARFQGLMCIIKYTLPLFYLWLGYTAINDEYDLLHFMKTVAIGMCVYALIIGGFSAKFMAPLYGFLNFRSGGLFISYASLADYFSGLVVVPIGLFIFTRNPKWLWATVWVILSTILETVRTGLGGLFLASSFLLFTVYRSKAVPWIAALLIGAVAIVFTVPEFRDKMFVNKNTTYENFSASDANFKNIHSNGREAIWNHLMEKYYYPHKLTGSGIGTSNYDIKNSKNEYFHKVQLIHSDYVQLLCDVGLIGVVLFGIFVLVTLLTITGTAWQRGSPWELKVIGGMALGSCAGTFFSMAYDNVVTYSQQSFVLPFVMIGIYLKIKDLHDAGQWGATDELEIEEEESLREIEN